MAGGRPILLLILLALFVGSAALYTVDEREHALKLRFGEIVDADIPPGLHFKLPVVNTVNFYPRRLLTIINPQEQFLTFEKKNAEVAAQLHASGVEVHEWSPEDLQKFREAAQASWSEFATMPETEALVESHLGYLRQLGFVE